MNLQDLPPEVKNFEQQYNRRQSKFWRIFKIVFFIVLILIICLSIFSYKVIPSSMSVLSGLGRLPVIKQFRQLIGMEKLKGELDDRINFLILGQGGPGHDGPYLTDTIILGSYKPSTNNLALISIPRDFYAEIDGYGWNKINSANSYGETNNYSGGGSAFTAKMIEKIFDIPIHYWVRFDFKAFEDIVNDLGGVEVCVDKSFADPSYPTDDFKTQTVSFQAGCQQMSGDLALIYTRSRHGNNGEGSDFARSARQQKIIMAIKDKILSLGFFTSPQKISNLFNTLKENIQTNVEMTQLPYVVEFASKIKQENIKRIVLDNSAKGLLKADVTDIGAYVLLPRVNDYSELRNLAKNIFIIQNGHELEAVKVIVLNSTKVTGLASDTAGFLNSVGFEIVGTGNASSTSPYEKSVVFSLKDNSREDVFSVLTKSLNANGSTIIPDSLKKQIEKFGVADFLIVLGCDAKTDEKCKVEEK